MSNCAVYELILEPTQVILRRRGGSTCLTAGLLGIHRGPDGNVREVVCNQHIHFPGMQVVGWSHSGAVATVLRPLAPIPS